MLLLALFIPISWAVSVYTNGYSRAKRRAKSDPQEGAAMLAREVRRDLKATSVQSLLELESMEATCALRQLVELMDLPDGKVIGLESRKHLWNAVQRRVSVLPDRPVYEPDAPLDVRTKQKAEWVAYLDRHHIGS